MNCSLWRILRFGITKIATADTGFATTS